jgi:hypothetical protein
MSTVTSNQTVWLAGVWWIEEADYRKYRYAFSTEEKAVQWLREDAIRQLNNLDEEDFENLKEDIKQLPTDFVKLVELMSSKYYHEVYLEHFNVDEQVVESVIPSKKKRKTTKKN